MSNPNIAILGAGSWGTALAIHLARLGHIVSLWVHGEETYATIQKEKVNKRYLPGIPLPDRVFVTTSLESVLENAHKVLIAIPSKYLRATLREHASAFDSARIDWIVSTVKGIEPESKTLMSEVILSELPGIAPEQVAVLSGPSFARELAEKKPTAVVVASSSSETVKSIQKTLSGGNLRVYRHHDILGVQLGGALKNVIALAAGIIAGRELGYNALAALITRGLVEIVRFGVALGAERRTFYGLSGIGDLVLTCHGPLSRNRMVGFRLGQNESLDSILAGMIMTVEGIPTSLAVRDWAAKLNIDMPIIREVTAIIHEAKPVDSAVRALLERPLKSEFDDGDL